MNLRLLTVCSLAVSVTGPIAGQQIAPKPRPLLTLAERVPASAHAWDAREKRLNPTIRRSRFVRVDADALRAAAGRSESAFSLNLFGTTHVFEVERHERVLGYDRFTGGVRGRTGDIHFVVAPDGVVVASIHLVEDSYAIAYAATDDIHVLQQLDDTKSGLKCAAHRGNELEQPIDRKHGTGPADASGNTVLDVMMFYTPRARSTAGGKSAIEALCVSSIAQANATNKASAVAATFRLVYMAETNYTENGSGSDLSRFRSTSDGYMDEVHALRNTYGGDLMHLITQPTRAQYCGVAYLMTRQTTGFRTSSFGVTLRQCMASNVVAHELGHNIGCHHDRNNAGRAIFNWAYGFRTSDSRYRTVMSYSPGSRVNMWSSPNHRFQNYVMGRAGSEDNARTITSTKSTVANFKPMTTLLWCDEGGSIPGFFNFVPKLEGEGTTNRARPIQLKIRSYRPNAPGVLIIGAKAINLPFLGGKIVPSADINLVVSGSGPDITFDANALSLLPPGSNVWFQAFFLDDAAAQGVSATAGVKVTRP